MTKRLLPEEKLRRRQLRRWQREEDRIMGVEPKRIPHKPYYHGTQLEKFESLQEEERLNAMSSHQLEAYMTTIKMAISPWYLDELGNRCRIICRA